MLNLLQSRQQAISQIRHLLQNRFGLMTSKLGQHTSKYKKNSALISHKYMRNFVALIVELFV